MVLGKLPVPGRPTIWMIVGQGPVALAVGAGGGCLDIFTFLYLFSPLSPSLWETARYRLKYCLKRPLNPKQPTNQPKSNVNVMDFPNPVGNKPNTSFFSAIASTILLCSGLSMKSKLNFLRISDSMSLDAILFCYVLYI